ncbi:MAG: prepilin peptidase [Candidatus Paceibacterota bacterium]|jgi:prepilin signal peptidase PulO-like enzyme (type II secretory pathway)
MMFLAYPFIFVLGAIIGSFLNVLILRYNTGRSLGGRSACNSCSAKLSWFELIPIASFIFQRGRCRSCMSAISFQYLTVELLTGIAFLAVAYRELPLFSSGIFYIPSVSQASLLVVFCQFIIFPLLIAITVYDLRHKIIPDGFVWTFVAVSFVRLLAGPVPPTFYDFLAGPVLALPFVLMWLLSRGRAIGLGDAKIALGIGWMLGFAEGVSALLLSFWIGGIVGLFLLLNWRKKFNMKSEVPFAPFMVAGVFLTYIFKFDFFGIKSIFW